MVAELKSPSPTKIKYKMIASGTRRADSMTLSELLELLQKASDAQDVTDVPVTIVDDDGTVSEVVEVTCRLNKGTVEINTSIA